MRVKEEIIEHIDEIKDMLVIVEGKNDRKALIELGIVDIISLDKRPIFVVVEEIISHNREVVILTDLDKEGKKLYGKLNSALQQFGVRVNNKFRDYLFKETKLRQIEGLGRYCDRMLRKTKRITPLNI